MPGNTWEIQGDTTADQFPSHLKCQWQFTKWSRTQTILTGLQWQTRILLTEPRLCWRGIMVMNRKSFMKQTLTRAGQGCDTAAEDNGKHNSSYRRVCNPKHTELLVSYTRFMKHLEANGKSRAPVTAPHEVLDLPNEMIWSRLQHLTQVFTTFHPYEIVCHKQRSNILLNWVQNAIKSAKTFWKKEKYQRVFNSPLSKYHNNTFIISQSYNVVPLR